MIIFYELFNLLQSNLKNILIALLIFGMFYIFSSLLSLIIVKLLNIKVKGRNKLKKIGIYLPIKRFFKLLGLYLAILVFKLSPQASIIVTKIFKISTILLASNALANCVQPTSNLFKALHKKITNENQDDTLTTFISKILKVLIYLFAFVIILSELGYDINGLIAGLGLAGLTVSLAAQDAAKNLFGGVIIILDRPFKQGDWITTSTFEGIVEEINFRSTRVRTFDDTLLTVPNSTLANIEITNWSKMHKRKVIQNIQLDYSTKLNQLSKCCLDIENMLRSHKDVNKDLITVKFTEIADSGFNIMIHYFTNETNYIPYNEVKEDINYNIMHILEKNNVELAYPSQTLYIKK